VRARESSTLAKPGGDGAGSNSANALTGWVCPRRLFLYARVRVRAREPVSSPRGPEGGEQGLLRKTAEGLTTGTSPNCDSVLGVIGAR
jgi:hypothetical protein